MISLALLQYAVRDQAPRTCTLSRAWQETASDLWFAPYTSLSCLIFWRTICFRRHRLLQGLARWVYIALSLFFLVLFFALFAFPGSSPPSLVNDSAYHLSAYDSQTRSRTFPLTTS
jgi:glucan phosphoethanolaminetransferase (alkaline phosphatase superfamily)